jgi:hypothetical protein
MQWSDPDDLFVRAAGLGFLKVAKVLYKHTGRYFRTKTEDAMHTGKKVLQATQRAVECKQLEVVKWLVQVAKNASSSSSGCVSGAPQHPDAFTTLRSQRREHVRTAVKKDCVQIFEFFRKIEYGDSVCRSWVMEAARNGSIGIVRYLHTHNLLDMRTTGRGGKTVVMNAVAHGNLVLLRYLRENALLIPEDLTVRDYAGRTVLGRACSGDDDNAVTVAFLVEECGADIHTNISGRHNETQLHTATRYLNPRVCKYLLTLAPDLADKQCSVGNTAFLVLVGKNEITDLPFRSTARVDEDRDAADASEVYSAVLRCLCEVGKVRIDMANYYRGLPLFSIGTSKDLELIKYIIRYMENHHAFLIQGIDWMSPMLLGAVQENDIVPGVTDRTSEECLSVVKHILDYGSERMLSNVQQWSRTRDDEECLLTCACTTKRTEVVELLLSNSGLRMYTTPKTLSHALHVSLLLRHYDIASLLIGCGGKKSSRRVYCCRRTATLEAKEEYTQHLRTTSELRSNVLKHQETARNALKDALTKENLPPVMVNLVQSYCNLDDVQVTRVLLRQRDSNKST